MEMGLLSIISLTLFIVSVAIFIYTIKNYRQQALQEIPDGMGQSITFDYGYLASIIPLSIGILLHPGIKWWWSIVSITSIIYAPILLKLILGKIFK